MTEKLQRLELTWPGKEDRFNPEPRILLEDKKKSYSRSAEQTDLLDSAVKPTFDNMLIHGDNLLALKALEQDYSGKIKCIYIDPPYNTGNAFEHYDDGLEHSIWLSLMRDRLEILKRLLAEDGSIFIQINDDEYPYLKIICDEVFGRNNYEATFYVKVRHENRILREDTRYQLVIEQVLFYKKSNLFIPPRREKTKDISLDYIWDIEIIGKPTSIERIHGYDVEIYKPTDYKITKSENGSFKQYQIRGSLITQKGSASEYYEQNLRTRRELDGLGTLYKVIGMGINGDGLGYRYIIQPSKSDSKNGFYFQGKPKKSTVNKGLPYPNFYDCVNIFNNAGYEGGNEFRGGKKPEDWICFLLSLVTNPGDLVLDSFLGSGTTAAVAQKMGRRWIGVEMGDHVYTHCIPRLKKVIDGEDQGGITKAVNWQGGGGFKFYELASSLIVTDKYGQQIISKEYNADMLAEAMCKILGYRYKPDKEIYWKQGFSSEKNFIYTTTMSLQESSLDRLAEEIGDNNLLICCSAFVGNSRIYPNISVKKIPAAILKKCEWGREGYPLNLRNYHPTDEEFEFEEE
jgi:adenine specific DNA methylase MOD